MKVAQALSRRKSDIQLIKATAYNLSEMIAPSLLPSNPHIQTEQKKARDLLCTLTNKAQEAIDLRVATVLSNSKTLLPNGMTVMEAIVRRDYCAEMLKVLDSCRFQVATSGYEEHRDTTGNITRTPITLIPHLPPETITHYKNSFSVKWRELDDLIQASNWATELPKP